MDLVKKLRNEKYWLVEKVSKKKEVKLNRLANGKVVSIRLVPSLNNKYRIIFPSYLFFSKISHFSPVDNEYRNCRNKAILKSLVKLLKRSSIWDYIENKDFLTINDHNKRSDKENLKKELKELYLKE